jgi:hypothetical protein
MWALREVEVRQNIMAGGHGKVEHLTSWKRQRERERESKGLESKSTL